MDGLALSATAASASASASASAINRSLVNFVSTPKRWRAISFSGKSRFVVRASQDNPKLDEWDQMELKFGRLLGEDPKLTLAKIMGRKSNPDVSYLEIEKSFYKKKGKSVNNDVEEVPFEVSEGGRPSKSRTCLNLVRPVPKKGHKFETGDKLNAEEVKKPKQSVRKTPDNTQGTVPNVILRKPSAFYEDNMEMKKSSRLKIKPNLSLKMRKEPSEEKFSDIVLLKKPQTVSVETNFDKELEPMGAVNAEVSDDADENGLKAFSVLKETADARKREFHESGDGSSSKAPEIKDDSLIGFQPCEQSDARFAQKTAANELTAPKSDDSGIKLSMEEALQGKPKRLDHSVKKTSSPSSVEMVLMNPGQNSDAVESESFLASSILKEREDFDWTRAENLAKSEKREEVELISCSTRGFVVSFGSLIGFLPYRNLVAKWKFFAFESWLRRKGFDPSMYRKNLGVVGSDEVAYKNSLPDSYPDPGIAGEMSPDMKLEDLLRIYDEEKTKFLSSFIGQRVNVNVLKADQKSRKLIFSVRPKEKEELVEKKRSLMAKLSVGDIVKCCVKKITYFGIFVEVEGVSALIHQSEVSWNATLDPASYFKIGQVVEAKVHQLDFALERIFLSLKEITPDPLTEALECIVGDRNSLDGRLEAAQADTEWTSVEWLIKELRQIKGIQSVSKGHFFLSPGLAPTFQVYMASMFENQYKLLARSGNKVQEVMVQASLGKEEMKSVILTCTNRVE